jgi:glycosyltransferase involved in cell wall biosynthesis
VKVGILVLAYNAETTIADVLRRIPAGFRTEVAEVLVQDDHSSDRTYEVTQRLLQEGTDLPLTVVRHERNLGYGGNQKAGYRYAIEHGWDVVVMLHGDGQYAPEALPDMVRPIVEGDADAVFGSRMLERGQARAGGMPTYKYIGNRVLTTFQNTLTGLRLSEWHSGYRAYRVSALADLPLVANSDGFDFDTEIILQLHAAGKHIVEVPIPTFYGDEICYVNGTAYARDIVIDTLRYRLGEAGFGAGQIARVGAPYGFRVDGTSAHGRVLGLMAERSPCRVLDVGCGAGWLSQAMRDQGHHVTGVDRIAEDGAEQRTDRFVLAPQFGVAEHGLPDEVGDGYDVIVAVDVIDKLPDSERLLRDLVHRLAPGGVILASVPNISHWYPRFRIALGLFGYDQRGILDRTNLRFFTRRSFLQLLRRCGLEVRATRHVGLPFDAVGLGGRSGAAGRLARRLDAAMVRLWPTMFAYQFVFEVAERWMLQRPSPPPTS